jgi:hypothetical protein
VVDETGRLHCLLRTLTGKSQIIFLIGVMMSYSFILNTISSTTIIILTYQGKC